MLQHYIDAAIYRQACNLNPSTFYQ